jgi:L-aspartate oxidase
MPRSAPSRTNEMHAADPIEVDFVIVGSGVAGLRAAIELGHAGSVLVLAKSELAETATALAQAGIAAALSDEDEISLHEHDTIEAGDGLCDSAAVRVLVEEGPHAIQELIAWGTHFERNGAKLSFTREGAHSRSRVLHANGGATGREIGKTLAAKAHSIPNIKFQSRAFTTELIFDEGRVAGLFFLDETDGTNHTVLSRAVLLAAGGCGHIFRDTTNPAAATGDGMAMAYDAGAELRDMEFVQFHPTALQLKGAPRLLLPQSLLREGGALRNADLERFLKRYHEGGEQAPREAIARAIVSEMQHTQSPFVYVDMTRFSADSLRRRFPRVYSTCQTYGVDLSTDLVPVSPAAHYAIGGVKTDLQGRSSLPGLYAAGETAANGVHGANRLASNALLEGLVFGARAGRAMAEDARSLSKRAAHKDLNRRANAATNHKGAPDQAANGRETTLQKIRALLWEYAGILRDRHNLAKALEELDALEVERPAAASRPAWELHNMWTLAQVVARCALAREESRGCHYRSDFPFRNDERFQKHSVASRGKAILFESASRAKASGAAM